MSTIITNAFKQTEFDLSDKVVVVVGGAGQIGSELSNHLTMAGATLIIVDSSDAHLNETGEFIVCDITSELDVGHAATKIVEKFLKVDCVINLAHFKGPRDLTPHNNFFASLEDYPLEMWNKTLEVNLTGLFLCTKLFGRQMLKQGCGVFINTSSTYGVVSPYPGLYGESGINSPVGYATTKAAIINFTRYVAAHWGCRGIRANCIVPGGVEHLNQDDEFKRRYRERTMLGRMAKPGDYNSAMLFLASDASNYMTGACLTLDGGWTAW